MVGGGARTNPSSASHTSFHLGYSTNLTLTQFILPHPPFQAMSGEGEDNYSRFVFICVVIFMVDGENGALVRRRWRRLRGRFDVGGGGIGTVM